MSLFTWTAILGAMCFASKPIQIEISQTKPPKSSYEMGADVGQSVSKAIKHTNENALIDEIRNYYLDLDTKYDSGRYLYYSGRILKEVSQERKGELMGYLMQADQMRQQQEANKSKNP